MYFQRSLVVASMVHAASERTEFFATVYSFSAVLICGLQLLATGVWVPRLLPTKVLILDFATLNSCSVCSFVACSF